jgi:hypothetical protein
MRALSNISGMSLPAIGTLARLPFDFAVSSWSSLLLLLLLLPGLSLLTALTFLLPSADGCEHLVVRSSTLGHGRDDLLQSGVLVVGRTYELGHLCRSGLDGADPFARLPSEMDQHPTLR